MEQLVEQLVEQLQLRHLQRPPFPEHRRSPHNRTRQQRSPQQLQMEDLGVQGVQGVRVVLLHPDRRRMDAF